MKIAVILFVYNRPKYLRKALKTHKKIEGLDYYAFIDYSEKQSEIMDLVADSRVYDKIYLRLERYGLNRNITEGITQVFREYDAVITLEDDLVLSKDTFYFLVNQLLLLEKDKNCGSVSLYKGAEYEEGNKLLVWATWKDRWERYKFIEGQGSQGVQFWRFHKRNNLYCRCSDKKRVKHIGARGEHFKWYSKFGIRQYLRRLKW